MTITKTTVRKYLHLLGVLITGAAGAAIWIADLGLPLSAKISGSLVLATTLLTSLKGALGKANEWVDLLPIPEGTTTTTTTTTSTTPVVQNPRGQDPDSVNTPAKPHPVTGRNQIASFPVSGPDDITKPFKPNPTDPTG
jgi:hypothetical protein